MRVGNFCAFFVVLLISGLANQSLVPLSKRISILSTASQSHLTELEEVSWFTKLKPTCDTKKFNADKQYARLKASITSATTPAAADQAKTALKNFLNICTMEDCPINLDSLNRATRSRGANERLLDFYNTICRPILSVSESQYNLACARYPEILSDFGRSLAFFSSNGQADMVNFLKENLARIKASNCRPPPLVFTDPILAVNTAGYLLNRIKSSDIVEEEAQLILDRLIMLFNRQLISVKPDACDNFDDVSKDFESVKSNMAGVMYSMLDNMKEIIKFYCVILPKL